MMFLLFTLLAGLAILPFVLYIRYPYLAQDVLYMLSAIRVGKRMVSFKNAKPCHTILDCFLDRVNSHPEKTFIIFEQETYTYRDADKISNKVARTLSDHANLKEGDTVALFLGNEPFYVWIWLGLAKLGCTAALLNYNIRSKSLLHCFSCCGAKALIAAAELKEAVEEVLPTLREQNVSVYILSETSQTEGMSSLRDKINLASDEPLSKTLRFNVTLKSPALYIYTSGTTGLTVVMRRKFSASQFWDDCRKHRITVIQYIGEIMRYLCNSPKKDNEKAHCVRLALGNGIRADTWSEFLHRFGDVRICECYGATEGNIGFVNYVGKIGAIGRVNFFHKMIQPYALIKYDTETEEPVRDSRGFCVEVPQGETGLLVAKITKTAPFKGYAKNTHQTEKKKLRDVFEKGDLYFNSGDLMKTDQEGFIYFQDRIGDTFRWKGENVATTEVSDILIALDFIEEANVYGVKVPGHEGRIGMAAIKVMEGMEFDSTATFEHVQSLLPVYARPRFIRIQNSLDITGTFKQMKVKLSEEGFNPRVIQDSLYFLDEKRKNYVPLSEDTYDSISDGRLRL
ncbi:very long-chain acyl-CoA synthetase isoform X2 [Chanos chanos]|uniref:long-chain-fatty-acid--CoA ligase n=1 Tax=Chanos chanos TaxID=29144 RepID=A0A6J2UNK6_CHACN|nr:very long-chain acyl-CoA synthetase isoform X2 [Chanos chanos]